MPQQSKTANERNGSSLKSKNRSSGEATSWSGVDQSLLDRDDRGALSEHEERIVHNDQVGSDSDPFGDSSLRMNKLEMIFKLVRDSIKK
jgi:hypothetical protein